MPKDPSSLTFGSNGFHLKYENASDLGNDSSGNNNDFTAAGLGTDHKVLDHRHSAHRRKQWQVVEILQYGIN